MTQHEKLPLVGPFEIAMRAGVQRNVINKWIERDPRFPKPVAELHNTTVWWWPDVENWLIATKRRTNAGWTLDQVSPPRKNRIEELRNSQAA